VIAGLSTISTLGTVETLFTFAPERILNPLSFKFKIESSTEGSFATVKRKKTKSLVTDVVRMT
jgi:hypothetical protein